MAKYLVILNDNTQQIYNGYTQEELVNTLYEQGVTDADVFILDEENKI